MTDTQTADQQIIQNADAVLDVFERLYRDPMPYRAEVTSVEDRTVAVRDLTGTVPGVAIMPVGGETPRIGDLVVVEQLAGGREVAWSLRAPVADASAMEPLATFSGQYIGPLLHQGGPIATVNVNANRVVYVPFRVPRRLTVDRLAVYRVGTSTNAVNCQMGIYACDVATGRPTGSPITQVLVSLSTTAGWKESSLPSPVTLEPGWYFIAYLASEAATFAGLAQANLRTAVMSAPLALINTGALTIYGGVGQVVAGFGLLPTTPNATLGEFGCASVWARIA